MELIYAIGAVLIFVAIPAFISRLVIDHMADRLAERVIKEIKEGIITDTDNPNKAKIIKEDEDEINRRIGNRTARGSR